jgi:hypothetical protein
MHFLYLLAVKDGIKSALCASRENRFDREAVWKMVVQAQNDMEARTLASTRESVRSNYTTLKYWTKTPELQILSIDCTLLGVAVENESKVICTYETHL